MQSQGSPVAQGDAYLTRYDSRGGALNAAYAPKDRKSTRLNSSH